MHHFRIEHALSLNDHETASGQVPFANALQAALLTDFSVRLQDQAEEVASACLSTCSALCNYML